MKRLFTHNLVWKLLALAIAFLLWVGLASEPDLATSLSVPIFFRNIPEDLDISSGIIDRVHLEIRGPARRLSPESLSQAAVVLNLSDVRAGDRTFTIRDVNIRGLPIGVAFYRALPSQIGLRFERLLTKDVPILPLYSAPPPDGYAVVKYWFDPAKVRLRGPEAHVQGIDHATTDPIDLSNIVGRDKVRVRVRLSDPQVGLETSGAVVFNVDMRKVPARGAK